MTPNTPPSALDAREARLRALKSGKQPPGSDGYLGKEIDLMLALDQDALPIIDHYKAEAASLRTQLAEARAERDDVDARMAKWAANPLDRRAQTAELARLTTENAELRAVMGEVAEILHEGATVTLPRHNPLVFLETLALDAVRRLRARAALDKPAPPTDKGEG